MGDLQNKKASKPLDSLFLGVDFTCAKYIWITIQILQIKQKILPPTPTTNWVDIEMCC